MLLKYQNLTVRNAEPCDAAQLAAWWNNGKIMAHAGFPLGIGQAPEEIAASLAKDTDTTHRRLIVEMNERPIGEMNYRNKGNGIAEIGIKICDLSLHDRGLGKILLSVLISSLFRDMGYCKIILDTNLNNKRAQHVYEKLGFIRTGIRENSWKDQLGELQTSIDYVLSPENFVNFAV